MTRAETFSPSVLVAPETKKITIVAGRYVRPASTADIPRICCRYSVRYRKIAKNDAEIASAAICAPAKFELRNIESGSIGSRTRLSITRNATSSTAAAPRPPTISGLPQPSSLPRSSASTSRKRPAPSVIWPGTSTRRAAGSLDSLT